MSDPIAQQGLLGDTMKHSILDKKEIEKIKKKRKVIEKSAVGLIDLIVAHMDEFEFYKFHRCDDCGNKSSMKLRSIRIYNNRKPVPDGVTRIHKEIGSPLNKENIRVQVRMICDICNAHSLWFANKVGPKYYPFKTEPAED